MDHEEKIVFWVMGILVLLLLSAVIIHYRGLLSIGSLYEETHEIIVSNQTFLVTAPFGKSGYACDAGTRGIAQTVTNDESNASLLNVHSYLPYTGVYACGQYDTDILVTLPDLDLRSVQKIIISRDLTIQVAGDNVPSYSYDLMGITESWNSASAGSRSADKLLNFGDIVITNDGSSITINAPEGRNVIPIGDKKITFSHKITATDGMSNSAGGGYHYKITGVQVTLFPTKTPPVVVNNVSAVPTSTTHTSFFSSFIAWIKKTFWGW